MLWSPPKDCFGKTSCRVGLSTKKWQEVIQRKPRNEGFVIESFCGGHPKQLVKISFHKRQTTLLLRKNIFLLPWKNAIPIHQGMRMLFPPVRWHSSCIGQCSLPHLNVPFSSITKSSPRGNGCNCFEWKDALLLYAGMLSPFREGMPFYSARQRSSSR